MTVDAWLIFFGALVAVLPYLGFPSDWDTVILLVSGVSIAFLGIIVRRRGLIPRVRRQRKPSVYVESVPRENGAHEGV